MTFEEWKEKHNELIEKVTILFFNYERGVDTKTCYDELEYLLKKAFISGKENAGYKAGKPKWHKVADGDLPPVVDDGEWLSIIVLSDTRDMVYYDYEEQVWKDSVFSTECEAPCFWCEIPKYEEE